MFQRTFSKKLSSLKPDTLYVGVDLALDHNVAVVRTKRTRQSTRFHFPNERDSFTKRHPSGGKERFSISQSTLASIVKHLNWRRVSIGGQYETSP